MNDLSRAPHFPYSEPPPHGEPIEVAPGVLWLRLALPYALNHINTYLLEDEGGWVVFDTGIGDDRTREVWEHVLSRSLGGKPITRVLVSHYHSDHIGMAGWLHDRFLAPLCMAQTEFLFARLMQSDHSEGSELAPRRFYHRAGLDEAAAAGILGRGLAYLKRTTTLPRTFSRLLAGETIRIGGRTWRILTGGGHALEQVMLWCEADRLFLAADQVLARITPNISVTPTQPDANPLGLYLRSLAELRDTVPDDVFVLPGHNMPFHGLHRRLTELLDHHAHRCALIVDACKTSPRTCAEIIPVLFHRKLDDHQLSFAVGEALAHLNYMLRSGALRAEPADTDPILYRAA